MIRLSIIIPFYNVEQYIAQCLESVYRQDIPEEEYEVICVDDCSPDNSIAIVEDYAKGHSNLVIVRNKFNRKLGGARNAGMEVAKGEYIWFVDSDDFIEENCAGKLLSEMENEDLDMLHFNHTIYPDSVVTSQVCNPVHSKVMTGVDMLFSQDFIWYNELVTAWCKLYKKKFLLDNNILFAEHMMFEDNDYAILAFANALRVKHVAFDAYHYRYNPQSITHVKHNAEHIYYWLNLVYRLDDIKERFWVEQKDERLLDLITSFNRYLIAKSLEVYSQMDKTTQKESYRIIKEKIQVKTLPYMSKIKYFKIKLGIF